MQLNDIRNDAADQQRGKWFELLDPVDGKKTSLRVKLAGPDSETQNAARLFVADELSALAASEGVVTAAARDRVRLESPARCILDWEVREDDQPVPFSQSNVMRLLRAASWVQAQIDSFAADRSAFRGVV